MRTIDTIMEEQRARSLAKLWARPAVDIGGLIRGERTPILHGIPTRLKETNQPTLLFLPHQPQDAAAAMSNITFHTEGSPSFKKPAEADITEAQRLILANINAQRIAAARKALGGHIDNIVATDGSVSVDPRDAKLHRAASGVIIWQAGGQVVRHEVSSRRSMKAAPSTYTVEGGAGVRGLQLVGQSRPDGDKQLRTVLWLLDARSFLDAMQKGPALVRDIFAASAWGEFTTLALRNTRVAVVHVYSHVGEIHNEAVDRLVGHLRRRRRYLLHHGGGCCQRSCT